MKYHLSTWAWGLTVLGLIFPLFTVIFDFYEGNLESVKEQGAAVILLIAALLSIIGLFLKGKSAGYALFSSAMAGVMLFAVGQFLPSIITPIIYVIAVIYFLITVWSALEMTDRLKNQRHSYFE